MPEPADRPPLRDQIAEALYRHTMDHAAGGPARLLTRDETILWENSLARADAVMHAVEAETAALRERDAVELEERIQAMRENGDNDMRTVLNHIRDVLRSRA